MRKAHFQIYCICFPWSAVCNTMLIIPPPVQEIEPPQSQIKLFSHYFNYFQPFFSLKPHFLLNNYPEVLIKSTSV